MYVCAESCLPTVQLQEVLLSYIANPQLELALVMLIVPFIVNVSSTLPAISGSRYFHFPAMNLTSALLASCPPQSIMFWVVDSLMMRKYKTAKGLEHSCEADLAKKGDSLPWTNGSDESQVRTPSLFSVIEPFTCTSFTSIFFSCIICVISHGS